MRSSRRDFLRAGAVAAAVLAAPRLLLADLGGRRPVPVPPIEDPRLKALVARGVDAARAAGAAYADVRLTHTWMRSARPPLIISDLEMLVVGVRALVDGSWGFASSAIWSPDELARLAREAVQQARANAARGAHPIELAPATPVRDGRWVMPVKIDPFEVPVFEIIDQLNALQMYATAGRQGVGVQSNICQFRKQEKAFGSTAGSYCTQRHYLALGAFVLRRENDRGRAVTRSVPGLDPAGVGWELYREQPLRERIGQTLDEMEQDLARPINPVDVGRYDVVFDAGSVARLLYATLGAATELDRAMGYEANAGGTSYITDPLGMLGAFQAGAPGLTVTANRSEPGGCATVKWDDEGVEPDDFALVKDGVLADFQTTRESAGWLKDAYAKAGRPLRSHGCASAEDASYAPLQRLPNLVLAPGRDGQDFDTMVAGLDRGLAVKDVNLSMDFQAASGLATGTVYEVKKGKRTALLNGPGLLFRSTDLWKALVALGGPASARRVGYESHKGEPRQERHASVTAVPATFKELTLIDSMRKA
jgi:TldD protein